MTTTLQAPFTLQPVALSTSYLGASNYLIEHARKVWIGLFEEGTGLVAGTMKLMWNNGGSVEVPIPSDNLFVLELDGLACIPPVFLDVKAGAGTPTLVLMAF